MTARWAASAAGLLGRLSRALTLTGSLLAIGLTLHTVVNSRLLRRPWTPGAGESDTGDEPVVTERVSVLVPARDEAGTLPALLASLRSQRGVTDLEILVLDDGSTDDTGAVVLGGVATDPRVALLRGGPLPEDWLGKPHACHQLAAAATGSVLLFVDADVVLKPHAVAATVTLLRGSGLDLISPYPRQLALGTAERLVQPLLQWSWLTTLPLRLAERSPRPSLSAANGQLIAVDTAVYRRAGGHAAVRTAVLEDIGLLRAVKSAGGRGAPGDGSQVASCRMYRSWPEVRDGYAKSLWAAFGTPWRAAAVMAVLALAYAVPPVAALTGSRWGLVGYAAAVAGRVVSGRATGGRVWPDALAHPASVAVAGWLTWLSWHRKRQGTLSWKGRVIR